MEKINSMAIHIFPSGDEAIQALARFFIETAKNAIAERGVFNASLSGGSSPKKLYELLATEYGTAIDWNKAYFFFGDERYVPADHADYNALMAKKALFDPLHIPAEQVFAVDTTLDPASAASAYAEAMTAHFKTTPIRFDLTLLGLGDDAHTASLFPHTPVLKEKEATIKSVFLTDKNVYRITMTAPLINQSRQIAFLTFGPSKAAAVSQVLKGEKNIEHYPAQLIEPAQGTASWFLDKSATAQG